MPTAPQEINYKEMIKICRSEPALLARAVAIATTRKLVAPGDTDMLAHAIVFDIYGPQHRMQLLRMLENTLTFLHQYKCQGRGKPARVHAHGRSDRSRHAQLEAALSHQSPAATTCWSTMHCLRSCCSSTFYLTAPTTSTLWPSAAPAPRTASRGKRRP